MTMRLLRLLAASVLAVSAAACRPSAELVLVNMSGRDIAVAPGVVIPSCATVSLTSEQVSVARTELVRWVTEEVDPFGWVPSGTVQFQRGIPGAPIGAPTPMTLVISSEEQPQIFHGLVPSDLPSCGGEPVGTQ